MPPRRKNDPGRSKQQFVEARRNKARGILKVLGLWDRVRRLDFRQRILDCHYPRPSVGLAEGVLPTGETAAILVALGEVVDSTRVPFPPLDDEVPITDLISHVLPISKESQRS